MTEKEKWIIAIENNSKEYIASVIMADVERIRKQQKEIEKLKKEIKKLKGIDDDKKHEGNV